MIHWVLSRCRWSPAASGPAGPTTAPQVVRPDHVKLLQMVRPAADGPPKEIFTISASQSVLAQRLDQNALPSTEYES